MTPSDNDNDLSLQETFDEDMEALFEDRPSLRALPAVINLIQARPWFENLGAPETHSQRVAATDYLQLLGFPDIEPVFIYDALEAQDAAQLLDVNDGSWEAEEQLRASLTTELVDFLGEELVSMVMGHLAQATMDTLADAARLAAVRAGIEDEDFVEAAFGAASQASHQAALVALTGEPDHPFSTRFRLFEMGRWPLAIVGRSFLIY